ncbi:MULTISPECIES: hypothetical protein [Bradyrhizobium]|uniref:hypothetical protein n=1 Tax=Bradyrhizobium elkanii TaxID=29448 RepID=UPI0027150079|nr:hypothetical protein [Bradyrhizobium elkanii]WLA51592.1 hypothetical protein QIH80_16535 [Bradyrhizobium elkanii]WLB78109.1 hypothetical protein QIH83_27595 [Bradyrhizobium elkanii]
MITEWLTDLRKWALGLGVYCIACTSAVACITQSSERGILFENVPTDIDAPVVIEATIYDITQVGDVRGFQMELMNARVDRVIKGSIDAKYLRIFVYPTSCTRVGVGQGIVLGTLRDDPVRGVMLEAVERADMRAWSKEFAQKQGTIFSTAKCMKNEFGVRECRLAGTGPEWTKP